MPPRPRRSVIWYWRERSRRSTLNSSALIFSPAAAFVVASSASSLGDMEVRRRGDDIGIAAEGDPRAAARRLITGSGAPMIVVGSEQGDRVTGGGSGGTARRDARAAIQVRRSIERRIGRLGLDLEHQYVAGIGVGHRRLERHRLGAA